MAVERFPVETGHVLCFARAVGDDNPAYQRGELAPPTFVAAAAHFDPEWPHRPHPGEPWRGSGREPTGAPAPPSAGGTSLHAEQHYEYHRPIRPGDVLTAEVSGGDRWEKESKRGGTLRFEEIITRYLNQLGDVVITARGVRVVTSKAVEQ